MVGSTLAFSLITRKVTEEIALIDINDKLAEAQVLDLQHAVPFCGSTKVFRGTSDDYTDSAVVAICCGAAQKPGQTRLDLVRHNSEIIKGIVPEVFEKNPEAIVVIVTNPVDVLTQLAISLCPERKDQIMGTGTLLDSARLRHLLSLKLGVNAQSIHAYIIGEHGDSELPLWSSATMGNMKLGLCEDLTEDDKQKIFEEARSSAYTIIEGKQATYYAIGAGGAQLISSILHNERSILPVSHYQTGDHGVEDICLSMPVIVGRKGILGHVCLELSDDEQTKLQASATILRHTFDALSVTVKN